MLFFVLAGPGWGVELNATTNWSPVWHLPFFLYVFLGVTLFAIAPLLFLSFQVFKKFEDKQLKKKWKFFILGVISLTIFMYTIFFANYLNIAAVRTIIGLIGIILALIGGYLMYIGVGRQLEK
jgi:drug/metabolite transporter (DMT)-like permease